MLQIGLYSLFFWVSTFTNSVFYNLTIPSAFNIFAEIIYKILNQTIMNFEKKLERIRIEIHSMSKKVIKLRYEYRSLKKIYYLEKEKSQTDVRKSGKPETRHQKIIMRNFERFARDWKFLLKLLPLIYSWCFSGICNNYSDSFCSLLLTLS